MKKNLLYVYYWFVSSLIFIAICIWFLNLFTNLLSQVLITDQEYMQQKYTWMYRDCLNFKPIDEIKKTPQQCKKEVLQDIYNIRKYNFKTSLIWSVSFIILFSLAFVYHYKKFKDFEVNG